MKAAETMDKMVTKKRDLPSRNSQSTNHAIKGVVMPLLGDLQ